MQAYLRDTMGSVLDHYNKADLAIKQGLTFLLQSVKNTPVRLNKAKCNKRRHACSSGC